MIRPDPLGDRLQRAYPAPEVDLDVGWSDVLRRAGAAGAASESRAAAPATTASARRRRSGRRPLAILPRSRVAPAIVLALVLLLCGTALAAATGLLGGPFAGFRDWLGTGPGMPASPAVQRTFAQANAASVAHFPRGTALRLLIGRELGGERYELYGFRAEDLLCLQLQAAGKQSPPSCAPVRQLQHGRQPAHLLLSGRRVHLAGGQVWTVSYGLATDAVHAVEIVDSSGRHEAALADNAFVYVARGAEKPLGAIAIDRRGDEVPIAIAATAEPAATVGGARLRPLSRSVRESGRPSGSLGWLLARRPRGAPLTDGALAGLMPAGARLLFARQIHPDPHSRLRVGVALVEHHGEREVCEILYEPLTGRLAGCAAARTLFDQHYVIGRMLAGLAGGQRYVLVGFASPQVFTVSYMHAGMDTFRAAPVRDGVFAIPMPVSSTVMWLQVDGRRASPLGTVAVTELESGDWRPSGSG